MRLTPEAYAHAFERVSTNFRLQAYVWLVPVTVPAYDERYVLRIELDERRAVQVTAEGWDCPMRHTFGANRALWLAHDSGSGAFGHEADLSSLDRYSDIYGIRALDSCRARQYKCSICPSPPPRGDARIVVCDKCYGPYHKPSRDRSRFGYVQSRTRQAARSSGARCSIFGTSRCASSPSHSPVSRK